MGQKLQAAGDTLTWIGQNWGNLASVVGLVVTGINAWQIVALRRRLEKRYTLIGRLPLTNKNLQQHCAVINECLASFDQSKHRARPELAKTAVTLKQLQETLPKETPLSEINDALQKISSYQSDNEDELRVIYTNLTVVVDTILYKIEDATWKSQ